MKKISLILVMILSGVVILAGCGTSETKSSGTSTFSGGDKVNVAGYEEVSTVVEGDVMITNVILSKEFTQKELEDIVRGQSIKGEKVILNFYRTQKEIEDKKPYTVAQIIIEKEQLIYIAA